ncbi:hypothetical protein MPSEU_000848500 [Mayamaea pseudoterrestris]|nr:hypothetical protein MPSEU_000848500 [Mayamaea pseudoterrestris]
MFFILISLWLKLRHRRQERDDNESRIIDDTTHLLLRNDPSLTHLTIQGELLSEQSLHSICMALRDNVTLQTLTLQNMHFDKSWMSQWLLPSLRYKALDVLELEDCSDDCESTLATALAQCHDIKRLFIRNCDFEPSNAWGNILYGNTSLTELRICFSPSMFLSTSDGNEKESSQNSSLTYLSLDFNGLGDEAAVYVAQLLRVPGCSIQDLSLFGNRIKHTGADELAQALYNNTSLTSLSLGLNRIGDAGIASLAKALTVNATLQSLIISSNRFGMEGLRVMADLLPKMQGLKHLDLGSILDQEAANAFSYSLRTNVHLNTLSMELAIKEDGYSQGDADLDFWLRLNRSGRRLLLNTESDTGKPSLCSDGLSARILAQSNNRLSPCIPDVLFYMLREKPELLCG